MVGGLGMRTIWVSLRAMNYTDRAFKLATKNVELLDEKEEELVKGYLRQKDVSRMVIQTNMLYAATLVMTTQRIVSMLAATEAGKMHLEGFNTAMEETKNALADTLFTALKPFINAFVGLLKVVSNSAPLRALIIACGALLVVVYGLILAHKTYKAWMEGVAATKAILNIITGKSLIVQKADLALVKLRVGAYAALAIAVAAGAGAFILMYNVGLSLKPLHAILIGLALAILGVAIAIATLKAVVSGGTSLLTDVGSILALTAIGGGAGLAIAGLTNYHTGTTGAPYTGLAMIKKGEVVYDPATERPTQIAADIRRNGGGGNVTRQDVRINIDTLNTKSDIEDLDEKMGRTLRRSMISNR